MKYDDKNLMYDNGSPQAEREKYSLEVRGMNNVLGKQVAN